MTSEKAISMLHNLAESIDNLYKLNDEGKEVFDMAIEALRKQDQALNEWCTDCAEYNHEKHCCPRFNRVIKSAFEDATDTNVGDRVSRQAAIDALEKDKASLDSIIKRTSSFDNKLQYFVAQHNQVECDIDAIKNLPSVEPKTFMVIDTKTGREANTYNIARKEEWAKGLCYCDIDMFVIGEDGTLMLIDDCGKCAYCPQGRFEVKWNE